MGKFITIVVIIYVVYYLLMILFDLFVKKTNTTDGDEGEAFDIEGFQTQEVGMTEEEIAIEEKLHKQDEMAFEDEEEEDAGGIPQDEQEQSIMFGQVETQGFTIDQMNQLLQESKEDGVGFMERLDAVSAERSSNTL